MKSSEVTPHPGLFRWDARVDLSNPALIYSAVWLMVLGLYSLGLTVNLTALTPKAAGLVVANIISFWVIQGLLWACVRQGRPVHAETIAPATTQRLNAFVLGLLGIWMLGTLAEVGISGGVPLLWAFTGSGKTYMDFGVPTFHGLMNCLYFFSVTALYLDYVIRRKRWVLALVVVLLGWPVLALARSVMLGAITQMAAVSLVLKPMSLRNLSKIAVLVLVVIIAFGFVGDLRGTAHSLTSMVQAPYQALFETLPSGFVWFYIYLTAPLSNLVANVEFVSPNYMPYYSVANLLPTVVRNIVLPDVARPDSFALVVENLNVSTYYAGMVSDFGAFGAFLIVAFMQVAIVLVWFLAKRGGVGAVLAYSVLFQSLLMSVFYNLLSSQVYLMQIALAAAVGSWLYRGQEQRHASVSPPSFFQQHLIERRKGVAG